jgi:CO/xanthine dehydrogenase Mo-binding subunit
VAAEAFGVGVERVAVRLADTATAPEAPVAGGSQTVYSGSPAVAQAALDARRQVLELAAEHLEAAPEDLDLVDGDVLVRGVPGRRVPLAEVLGSRPHAPAPGVGRSYLEGRGPAFTVHVCRVAVDAETGAWRVTRYAAFQDVGRAINPPEIEGQVHGGALQGLGRVLGERLAYDAEGQLRTGSFVDYELPAIDQAPPFEVRLLEVPSEHPLGVRGVGEPPAIPGPAAVVNALSAAAGVRLRRVPVDWSDLVATRPA